jgi:UDP-glucuronate 4-epimerase
VDLPRAILDGTPLRVINGGDMRRDFTYVDDVVAGVLAALDRPPPAQEGSAQGSAQGSAPHRRYNLGNHRAEELTRFIAVIERATNRKAIVEKAPMQPGDVRETFADLAASRRDLGFEPHTTIDEGVPRFVDWFRKHHGL